jgi:hypothetical protein
MLVVPASLLRPRNGFDVSLTTKNLRKQCSADGDARYEPIEGVGKTVAEYRAGHNPEFVEATGVLDGGDVLPGFALNVKSIFRDRGLWRSPVTDVELVTGEVGVG